MMEEKLRVNTENPEELEKMYREDQKGFRKTFEAIYPEIGLSKLMQFWKIRLDYDTLDDSKTGIGKKEVGYMLLSCLLAGFVIKLPQIFGFPPEKYLFYEKYSGLIVFLGLSVYLLLTREFASKRHILFTALAFGVSAIYISFLPNASDSHSITLAHIHLPLLAWSIFGLVFIEFDLRNKPRRLELIRYNGDMAILGAIILIAGIALTGITIGLFAAIDIQVEQFYLEYVVVWGLVSAPIVTAFIKRIYPFITSKIAPVVASIFSPLVLITLLIYLVTIPIAGKDPYQDRDFLLVFNLMLLGVMAIIVFSASETSTQQKNRFSALVLFALAATALLTDLVALSAIIYRLGEYGFTPNRTAVLGSNLLIFGNLLLITIDLFKVNFSKGSMRKVDDTIAAYLPLYLTWTIIVVFLFPVLFGFR